MSRPFFLLINPWIHDFAAYDLWIRPTGLLSIAGLLKKHGVGIHLIDCLDPGNHRMKERQFTKQPHRKETGCGHFYKEEIDKPEPLTLFKKKYKRYGISPAVFEAELSSIQQPDAVIVTSMMTYWYPGVFEAIKRVKQHFPDVPVLLGGVYATICFEHASSFSGADVIFTGQPNSKFTDKIYDLTKKKLYLDHFPNPDYELIPDKKAMPVLTSVGCPFSCSYCASRRMFPKFKQNDPLETAGIIEFFAEKYSTTDIIFYDDALLVNASTNFTVFLKEIIKRKLNLRFHTPNGMHIREITPQIAELMFEAGFSTIRLGLESSNPTFLSQTGNKVTMEEFINTASMLKKAGFSKEQVGAYILAGLPFQRFADVNKTVITVRETGIKPVIAEYSPIPHTSLWKDAVKASPYPLEEEPLFQNNTLLPCEWEGFTMEDLNRVKRFAREG